MNICSVFSIHYSCAIFCSYWQLLNKISINLYVHIDRRVCWSLRIQSKIELLDMFFFRLWLRSVLFCFHESKCSLSWPFWWLSPFTTDEITKYINKYNFYIRDADKYLARPGKKQANVSVRMAWIFFGALPCKEKKILDDSSRLDVVEIARVAWHASELVSFLVGLRTYQHFCI